MPYNDDDYDEVEHFYKNFEEDTVWSGTMDLVIGLACLVGIAILLALICRCCCGTKYRGRVLQPAPDPNSTVPVPPGPNVPYPQQQYSTVTVTAIPVGTGYPTASPYPTAAAPYPTGGAPYPNAGAPYPTGGAPGGYPAVGAPYPAVSPYSTTMPQPSIAPSAPDAHAFIGIAPPGWNTQALPPSYDQVMGSEAKQSPYNPYAPH